MAAIRPFTTTRQRGVGLVETMVGILIGLIVVLVIYNVFALAEGYKRTAVAAADAQTTGLYAQFVLARDIANGGNGISGAIPELTKCTKAALPNPPAFQPPIGNVPMRPIPVLIADGGPNASDSIIITYSTAPRVVSPVLFTPPNMAAMTDPFAVQSPNGFRVNDLVIAIDESAGNCELSTVTAIAGPDPVGVVTITHPPTTSLYSAAIPAKLVNLGQAGEAARTLYDVVNDQLRSTDLLTGGATPNPISQNVVLLKVQYGVDCNMNGTILWVSAVNGNQCGDPIPAVGTTAAVNYRPQDVQQFDEIRLARIRAIRVGIIVKSDEPEQLVAGVTNVALQNQQLVLFNCSTNNAACQGRVVVGPGAVLPDFYRYRTYETVVPLRNAIWNKFP